MFLPDVLTRQLGCQEAKDKRRREDRLAWLMSCSSLATSTKGAHVSFFLCASTTTASAVPAASDASASHLEIWFGLMWNPSIKTMCAAQGMGCTHTFSFEKTTSPCAFSFLSPTSYSLPSLLLSCMKISASMEIENIRMKVTGGNQLWNRLKSIHCNVFRAKGEGKS